MGVPDPKTQEPTIPLGTLTAWGAIAAVRCIGGERYYWLTDGPGAVAMMPACVVELREVRDEE